MIALGAAAVSAALLAYYLINDGPIIRLWRWYENILEQYYSILFLDRSASSDAALHITVCSALAIVGLFLGSLVMLLAVPVVATLPAILLEKRQAAKSLLISEQLAPWLTVLANSLKSSPNIADAFSASTGLVPSPLREEIDLLIKEVRLGEHLDRAMHRSAERLRSPLYSSVMTTLLVARKSGGNLPKILEDSSDTLREMERLAGVVRAKTAEGKSQTFVLAILPFVMVGALQKVDPTMLPKLAESGLGQIILGIAIALWLGSVALAYRIVQVDI
jgi:tight adherence protein B